MASCTWRFDRRTAHTECGSGVPLVIFANRDQAMGSWYVCCRPERRYPRLILGFDSQLDSHGLGYARMKPKELDRPMYENIRDGGGRTPFRRT